MTLHFFLSLRQSWEKSNSDDDDDEEEDIFKFALLFLDFLLLLSRKTKWEHQQLSWFSHVEKLQH